MRTECSKKVLVGLSSAGIVIGLAMWIYLKAPSRNEPEYKGKYASDWDREVRRAIMAKAAEDDADLSG